MNAVEQLLTQRWVLREKQTEMYYQIKDEIGKYRRFLMEKFGYSVLITPQLIKLDKIPGYAEPWMGIQAFEDPKDYVMLCMVLTFLESKEKEEQFVLSTLTEFLQSHNVQGNVDWTQYTQRKRLIRVLRYCLAQGMILETDGSEDLFLRDEQAEVLFENTGLSRFFLRSFSRDLLDFKRAADFENSEWIDMDQDRGIVRRQRVYRRLLLSLGVYRSSIQDEDFNYLRNQRGAIQRDFQQLFACDLHLHRTSAFLILDEDCSAGKEFPNSNAAHDLILILANQLQHRLRTHQQNYALEQMESLIMSKESLQRLIKKLILQRQDFLPKRYQLETINESIDELIELMERLGMVEIDEMTVKMNPIFGKVAGDYALNKEAK